LWNKEIRLGSHYADGSKDLLSASVRQPRGSDASYPDRQGFFQGLERVFAMLTMQQLQDWAANPAYADLPVSVESEDELQQSGFTVSELADAAPASLTRLVMIYYSDLSGRHFVPGVPEDDGADELTGEYEVRDGIFILKGLDSRGVGTHPLPLLTDDDDDSVISEILICCDSVEHGYRIVELEDGRFAFIWGNVACKVGACLGEYATEAQGVKFFGSYGEAENAYREYADSLARFESHGVAEMSAKISFPATSDETIEALRKFAKENGRQWRYKLCDAWTRGDDLGQLLQAARNTIGPPGLYKLNFK
jgi:hypothetical protein